MKKISMNALTLNVALAAAAVWLLAAPCESLGDEAALQDLIRAHAAGLGLVKTIAVDTETRRRLKASASDGTEGGEVFYSYNWKADFTTGKQRIRARSLLLKDNEFGPRGIYDLVVLPDMRYRLLKNWDDESPTKMNATFVGNVTGDVGVTDGTIPEGVVPKANLLWLVSSAPPLSLSDAVASSVGASRADAESIDGHRCEVIDIPYGKKQDGVAWKYKVYLDGVANFMIRKVAAQSTPIKVNGRRTPVTVAGEAYVTDFTNPDDGVYLPKKVVSNGSDSKYIVEHVFSHYEVNEDIPSEEFELVFPKWTHVRDMQTGKTQVMDGSGGILGEFAGAEGLRLWQHSMGEEKSFWSTPRILAMVVSLVIIVLLLRYRRALQG